MLGFILSPIVFILVVVYAPLMSVRALKSAEKEDDVKWLSFWVIWSVLQAIEMFSWGMVYLIPMYVELRFGLVVFMLFFDGANTIFKATIEPLYGLVEKNVSEAQLKQLETDPKAFLMDMFQKAQALAGGKGK